MCALLFAVVAVHAQAAENGVDIICMHTYLVVPRCSFSMTAMGFNPLWQLLTFAGIGVVTRYKNLTSASSEGFVVSTCYNTLELSVYVCVCACAFARMSVLCCDLHVEECLLVSI